MGGLTFDRAIALTGELPKYTYTSAWGLLAALGVLMFCFSSMRGMIMGDGRSVVDTVLRIALVVLVLTFYHKIVRVLTGVSDGLVAELSQKANWDRYMMYFSRELEALFAESDESFPERVWGALSGGVLSIVFTGTYFFVFVVFRLLSYLSGMAVALLNVLGPLLIVGGVISNGRTMGAWMRSLIQVLLWPVVPPFLMLMILNPSANALESGHNTAFVISQNLILGFLALFTPLFVAFLLGKGGMTMFGGAMMLLGAGMARRGALKGWGYARAKLGSAGGSPQGSAAEGGAQAGGGGTSERPGEGAPSPPQGHLPMSPQGSRERPDDHCEFVWVSARDNPQRMKLDALARVGGAPQVHDPVPRLVDPRAKTKTLAPPRPDEHDGGPIVRGDTLSDGGGNGGGGQGDDGGADE